MGKGWRKIDQLPCKCFVWAHEMCDAAILILPEQISLKLIEKMFKLMFIVFIYRFSSSLKKF